MNGMRLLALPCFREGHGADLKIIDTLWNRREGGWIVNEQIGGRPVHVFTPTNTWWTLPD
jgi:hypothetical protein